MGITKIMSSIQASKDGRASQFVFPASLTGVTTMDITDAVRTPIVMRYDTSALKYLSHAGMKYMKYIYRYIWLI